MALPQVLIQPGLQKCEILEIWKYINLEFALELCSCWPSNDLDWLCVGFLLFHQQKQRIKYKLGPGRPLKSLCNHENKQECVKIIRSAYGGREDIRIKNHCYKLALPGWGELTPA